MFLPWDFSLYYPLGLQSTSADLHMAQCFALFLFTLYLLRGAFPNTRPLLVPYFSS